MEQVKALQPVGVVGLILVLTIVLVMVVGLTSVLYLTSVVVVLQNVAVLVCVDVFLTVTTAVSVTVRVFVLVAVQAVADAVMQRQALDTAVALSPLYEAVFLDLCRVSKDLACCYRRIATYPDRYE